MWNKDTSISEPEVVAIKNLLIEKGIVDESAFDIKKNFDISSGATHYPIIFLVDVSGSLSNQRDALNKAIYNFVNDILKSRTTLSSSIDFAIITFADKVKVKRPFAYITDTDIQNNAERCSIGENELRGTTNMGSGMFVAWYLAEKRKLMYKDAGVEYKQPVFILISDLRNNESTKVGEETLIEKIISLYNMKFLGHKLGLLKALFGYVENSYNELIKGTIIDAPNDFAKKLSYLFALLVSTIAANESPDRYLTSDEDDDVYLIYNNNNTTSERIEELIDLFRDDVD